MNDIIIFIICVSIPSILVYMAWAQRRKVSKIAEKKWEEEDKTIYVRYGNFDIPILQSQLQTWNNMHPNEKWGVLEHLKEEVKGGRLTVEKTDGITKFVGITAKAKDIKHRQKQRTEGWKNSTEKN